jgi:hypothetical protein
MLLPDPGNGLTERAHPELDDFLGPVAVEGLRRAAQAPSQQSAPLHADFDVLGGLLHRRRLGSPFPVGWCTAQVRRVCRGV